MSMYSPHRSTVRALDGRDWGELVAREADRQARIEAAFDRSEAFERLGDREQALVWLETAEAMSGGLSPVYQAKRARLAEVLARRDRSGETA